MKMRKKFAIIMGCISLLGLCTVGCSGNASSEKSDNGNQVDIKTEEKEEKEEKTEEKEENSIMIEDLAWSVDEGIVDGDRFVLLELTNNSSYIITNFEMTFKEKKGISQKEKDNFYADVQEKFELSDEDIKRTKEKEISMHVDLKQVIESGEIIKNINCYYFRGSYYVRDLKHYNLVEPDIMTIKYIDQEQIHTIYYDFSSKKYSIEEKTDVAYQWTKTELGNKIPKPEVKVLESRNDSEQIFMFDAYGLSLEQFNSYANECKNLGYTVNESSHEGFYSADNEQGYNIYLHYDTDDESMSVCVKNPEE